MVIRALTHADRAAVAFSLEHLGEQSRFQRYLRTVPRLDPHELDRLLDVDHWHHEGLIALRSTPRAPVGIAEYVRLEDFETAELGVAVVDDWQHRGVGRALIGVLRERALAAGIRRFSATALRDNKAALSLLRELGPVDRVRSEGPLSELVVSLGRK